MPDDAAIAEHCKAAGKNPQNISTVEAFREEVLAWHAQGIQVSTMRQALADESVSQILIDIDSPSGSVYGVAELSILPPSLSARI